VSKQGDERERERERKRERGGRETYGLSERRLIFRVEDDSFGCERGDDYRSSSVEEDGSSCSWTEKER